MLLYTRIYTLMVVIMIIYMITVTTHDENIRITITAIITVLNDRL